MFTSNKLSPEIIEIFTDGSCHTQRNIGAWAAILLINQEEVVIDGVVHETTHNRMELLAVINAFEYLQKEKIKYNKAIIYSDSQYVVNLLVRKEKLKENNFVTKKGTPIKNNDLVQKLISIIETNTIELVKVLAHQKETSAINYNRKVDKLVRKKLRIYVDKIKLK